MGSSRTSEVPLVLTGGVGMSSCGLEARRVSRTSSGCHSEEAPLTPLANGGSRRAPGLGAITQSCGRSVRLFPPHLCHGGLHGVPPTHRPLIPPPPLAPTSWTPREETGLGGTLVLGRWRSCSWARAGGTDPSVRVPRQERRQVTRSPLLRAVAIAYSCDLSPFGPFVPKSPGFGL